MADTMRITFTHYVEEGHPEYDPEADVEVEESLPGKYEVCDRCLGKGSHCNPSIDGNGLTSEDFAEDPDFRDDYMSGMYDVPCYECKGARVVLVVDEDKAKVEDPEILSAYERHLENQAISRRERASEERWGF